MEGRTQSYKKWGERGQMSVFLSICLIIIASLLAFVVNVGLFVKAKINLQNAVDAAAWSGAAVQARQLTNMAYLNWELRNTYKEWMFKYYVIGQISLPKTKLNGSKDAFENTGAPKGQGPSGTSFRAPPFFAKGAGTTEAWDHYNLPSVCIHLSESANVCATTSLPGLPRFETLNMPGVGESHRKFMNSITATKAKDCSTRSDLNFGAAMIWAYGTLGKIRGAPAIAANRVGAWPQAIELAFRMRNLEMIANRPPLPCLSANGGSGCTNVYDLDTSPDNIPYNERPIKAFWSAYRNLSGGLSKEGKAQQGTESKSLSDFLAGSFKLEELEPNMYLAEQTNLSGFLISNRLNALNKYYVDLQIVPLNLVTFYTSFVSTQSKFEGIEMQAACPGSKTALPVPGYIMGFVKNPAVMTYYAVRAEANFVGLLYPFLKRDGIKIEAYAAAKPFGGRIGPRLFGIDNNNQAVTPRNEGNRSAAYLTVLGSRSEGFSPGLPIPTPDGNDTFWAKTPADNIGGIPASGDIKFAVPNLLYEYDAAAGVAGISDQAQANAILTTLEEAGNSGAANATSENLGLFNQSQYISFASNLVSTSSNMSGSEVTQSIINARRPTNYETLNYLVPTVHDDTDNLETQGIILKDTPGQYGIFAPFFGPNLLYETAEQAQVELDTYMANIQPSVNTFIQALGEVADTIRCGSKNYASAHADFCAKKKVTVAKGGTNYDSAAASIHGTGSLETEMDECDSKNINPSLAAKFQHFFKSNGSLKCEINPLPDALKLYWNTRLIEPQFPLYYTAEYTRPSPDRLSNIQMMTAYMPGKRRGALDATGAIVHPFQPGRGTLAKRNFYSTKFISIESVLKGSSLPKNYGTVGGIYSESGTYGTFPKDMAGSNNATNLLKKVDLSLWGGRLYY